MSSTRLSCIRTVGNKIAMPEIGEIKEFSLKSREKVLKINRIFSSENSLAPKAEAREYDAV